MAKIITKMSELEIVLDQQAEVRSHVGVIDKTGIVSGLVAIWGDVCQLDHPEIGTTLENQLILSLVNLEEEATLKKGPMVFSNYGHLEYRQREVWGMVRCDSMCSLRVR